MDDIFRAYDIRGIYPKEISEEKTIKIAGSFCNFLFSLNKYKKNFKIAVGRDGRTSSPSLSEKFILGIVDSGADAVDFGLTSSPMLYFAVSKYDLDGGVEISASHNPPNYNGFKLVREQSKPISEKTGLVSIKEKMMKGFGASEKGKVIKKDVLDDYVKFVLKDIGEFKPLKLVVDTANGVAGLPFSAVFKRLPFKVIHMFSEIDGSFPNHPPDPLVEDNLKDIKSKIQEEKADLGIAFDGDGDRIIFLDEKSEVIPADLLFSLVLESILKDNPKEKILYDLRSSNIVKDTIEKAGGVSVIGRVGHSFIKEKMREENILLAGELSGHYYSRERFFCESPFLILFKVLERLSSEKVSFSKLIGSYQKYFHSGEINFKVKDKKEKIAALEQHFKGGKIIHLDGLRVDFEDWWFNVRPSNTESLLRLVVEAKNLDLLDKKRNEISKVILN